MEVLKALEMVSEEEEEESEHEEGEICSEEDEEEEEEDSLTFPSHFSFQGEIDIYILID